MNSIVGGNCAPADQSSPRLLLVAGSGRSGTSTMVGFLKAFGWFVPGVELVSNPTNPKGFGESRRIVRFHNALLHKASVGVSDARPEAWRSTALSGSRAVRRTSSLARWISRNLDSHEKLVIKDPRLSWFLDVWIKVAGQAKADLSVIIMLRPPHEVLASKHTYYQGDQAAGYNHLAAAWINMLLNTELQTRPLDGRGVSRIFVEYSELLTDWRRVGRRIGTVLGDEGLNRPSEMQVASVEAFLDAGLRRMDGSKSRLDLANEIDIVLAESWVALQRLTDPKNDGPAVWDELDSLRRRYEEIYGSAQSVTRSTTEHAMRSMRPSRRISEGLTRRLGQNDASSAVAPFEGGRGNVPPGYVHLVPHWLRDRVPKSIKLSRSRLR